MTLSDLILPVTSATLWTATQMVVGFVSALFVGALLLPGLERSGYPQPDGATKEYKLTGMTLFFVAHVAAFVLVFGFGVSLTPVARHFWSLFVVANALAVLISVWLYARGPRVYPLTPALSRGERVASPAGDQHPSPSGRGAGGEGTKGSTFLRGLWLGVDLNPTWLGVDLKMFMYQPSLIGVNLLVVSFANAQHDLYGAITPQMGCLLAFWWAYLFTHYVKEEFMLSTWDVIAEKFGMMLVWGDLVYVPFLYSLPCWWVVDQTVPFSLWQSVALGFLYLASLWVFRQANWQKERFKRKPSATIWGKKPELVGGRLLASGWWGVGRKLNYTGEVGVYVCFALTAGFEHPWPYLLPLSLIVLLAQRAARDDRRCLAKYGEAWTTYCARARFRMIPFLY